MNCALLTFALVALSSPLQATANGCDLDCNNHGTCKFGNKNYEMIDGQLAVDVLPWGKQTSIDGMYCHCDSGYTGVTCEIKHEICNDELQKKCHHGGTCFKMYKHDNGSWEYRCDCTTAIQEDENGKKRKFHGEFCEYEETTRCGRGIELTCTNNAECKVNESGEPYCDCPDGFAGVRCEYKTNANGKLPCDLHCQNGGQCASGVKDYTAHMPFDTKIGQQQKILPFMELREAGFMHCVCPAGYTGLLCDVKFEQCADNVCYFGSTCTDDGLCDCTTAYTDDTSYAGFQCEYPSTTKCPSGNGRHPGDAFCTNNGICHDEGSHMGCYCPSGFSGPRCEVLGDVNKECDLECFNGGKCHHGVKYHEFGEILHLGTKESKLTKDGMFCSCPFDKGFTGVQCEIPVDTCLVNGSKDDHVCLYDGKCVKHGKDGQGHKKYTCDCSTTTKTDEDGNRIPLAGKFCEYEPTDICMKEGVKDWGLTDHFCTNNGKCKNIVDSSGERHRGCDCPEGFTGSHCGEKIVALGATEPDSSSSGAARKSVGIFLLVVFSLSVVAMVGIYVKNKRFGTIDKKASSDQFTEEEKSTPPETEISEDGEMENIEII